MIVCLLWCFVLCLFRIFTSFYFFIAVIAFMIFKKRLYHGGHTRNSILVLDHCSIHSPRSFCWSHCSYLLKGFCGRGKSLNIQNLQVECELLQSPHQVGCHYIAKPVNPPGLWPHVFPVEFFFFRIIRDIFLDWCASVATASVVQKREDS